MSEQSFIIRQAETVLDRVRALCILIASCALAILVTTGSLLIPVMKEHL